MNKAGLQQSIKKELRRIGGEYFAVADAFSVFVNARQDFGQYGSNIALLLHKKTAKPFSEIFRILEEKIFTKKEFSDAFEKIELAKNGFVNFHLSDKALFEMFREIFKGKNLPYEDTARKKKAQVEYVSANPTGPLTLANGRGAVLGDVIAKILNRSGFRVQKEFYVNDRGKQIQILGLSVLAAHKIIEDKEEYYRGEYLKELKIQKENLKKHLNRPEELGKIAARKILDEFVKKPLRKFGTTFDTFYSEEKLYKEKLDEAVLGKLRKGKFVYEKDGALYFKSSRFGDSEDRVLIKRSGEATYFLSDLAYHYDKFVRRKFDTVIDIWGADHQSHRDRLLAAVKALGITRKLEVLIMQLIHLRHGEGLLRMSKRRGVYVTLSDLVGEVGKDAIRFFFLMSHANTHIDFDVELAKKKSQDNPVYYLQYAYARISSIFEKAKIDTTTVLRHDPKKIFEHVQNIPEAKKLIVKMHEFFDVVADISRTLEVNKLATFSLEFAAEFHKFYERARIIDNDRIKTELRLGFMLGAQNFLKELFDIMGITPKERM